MGSFTHRNCDKNCVWGGQGSPQGSDEQCGPAKTPGSSMNSRVQAQAASRPVSVILRSRFLDCAFCRRGRLRPVERCRCAPSRPTPSSSAARAPRRARTTTPPSTTTRRPTPRLPRTCEYRTALYRVRITASAVHVTKGHKLLDAGNEQGALAEFLHAAEIDPSNEAAQQAIAQVRKKHGEVAPATETSLPADRGQAGEISTRWALRPSSSRSPTSR